MRANYAIQLGSSQKKVGEKNVKHGIPCGAY